MANKREEVFHADSHVWNISKLLRRWPELLTVKNHTLKLVNVYEQSKTTFTVPRRRKPDLKKPVIMLADGKVIDGWHRIELALSRKRATLPAVILTAEQEAFALES